MAFLRFFLALFLVGSALALFLAGLALALFCMPGFALAITIRLLPSAGRPPSRAATPIALACCLAIGLARFDPTFLGAIPMAPIAG